MELDSDRSITRGATWAFPREIIDPFRVRRSQAQDIFSNNTRDSELSVVSSSLVDEVEANPQIPTLVLLIRARLNFCFTLAADRDLRSRMYNFNVPQDLWTLEETLMITGR